MGSSRLARTALVAVAVAGLVGGLGFLALRTVGFGQPQDPAREGARLYSANCAGCHGDNGNRIPVVPLYSWDYLDQLGDPYIVNSITQGKNAMQPFAREQGGSLGEDQIEAIVRYLVHPKESGRAQTRLTKKLLDTLNSEPEKVLFPKSNLR